MELTDEVIDRWCAQWLGAGVAAVLFTSGHLSHVAGVRLADGREVVVKVREAQPRLAGCAEVHRSLWRAGFPCPEPLVGPVPLLGYAASAEALVPGGEIRPVEGNAVDDSAELLARLVQLAVAGLVAAPVAGLVAGLVTAPVAVSVAPNPPWVAWDHGQGGVWPAPDDRPDDLNTHPETAWLDDVGRRVQRRLARMADRNPVVGHGDWEAQNLRWHGRTPWVVHDWDSVVSAPEAVVVGLAASVWPCGAQPRAATVAESAAFIEAYQRASGRQWSVDEVQVSWAAGLWVYAFNAKKASLDGVSWLAPAEAEERLDRAG